jgi:hypothetical protein
MHHTGQRAALLAIMLTIAAPAIAGETSFVFIPRADSPGNDYSSLGDSSFDECARKCDEQPECKAFTFNQFDYTCFLKRAAGTATTFHAFAITGVKLSPQGPLAGTVTGSTGTDIVTIPQADSPGNDYATFTLFTSADCQRSCEADKTCNAFTYNQARSVCFLKRAANQWMSFYPWATTGIKLSPISQEPKRVTPEKPASALEEETSPSAD